MTIQRHNPTKPPLPDLLSPVREKDRVGTVRAYHYPSLLESPWLILVREGHDGLLYASNSLARALQSFAGMPYLDRTALKHLEGEGFRVEPVQMRTRKL
jgi:hypothetical protein